LKLARKRVDDGHFFIQAEGCDAEILLNLEKDEIIKYDSNAGGYFITHDIYEEWALDKVIEREFRNAENNNRFLEALGSSLPIRRAFRNWLSEKLLINRNEVLSLIEDRLTVMLSRVFGKMKFWFRFYCLVIRERSFNYSKKIF